MRLLVSAGPTREMIDEVRFLSNLSSGKTGVAIAEAARDRGHEVSLVIGPVSLSPSHGIEWVAVTSAREMASAIEARHEASNALVMSAAVSDYRPKIRHDGKLKKKEGPLVLELERNPDILHGLADRKQGRVHVGFALEVQDAEDNALSKLNRKNLDLLILNGPENFGRGMSHYRFLDHDGFQEPQTSTKAELADAIIRRVEDLVDERAR